MGKTKCKAFRAYFWFEDVIEDYSSNSNASSRISLQVNGGSSTGINGADIHEVSPYSNDVYDLQGRNVTKPSKGIYVKDGRKVIIK